MIRRTAYRFERDDALELSPQRIKEIESLLFGHLTEGDRTRPGTAAMRAIGGNDFIAENVTEMVSFVHELGRRATMKAEEVEEEGRAMDARLRDRESDFEAALRRRAYKHCADGLRESAAKAIDIACRMEEAFTSSVGCV